MKANELQVGDWVLKRNPDGSLSEHEIVAEDFVKWKPDGVYALEEIDCEPISITRELLIKNEFKPNEMKGAKYDFLKDCEINISRHFDNERDDAWILSVDSDEGYECAYLCAIFYIHELQHFLNGCQFDKKIVLI